MEKPNAKLTIRNAAKMTPEQRKEVVSWLLLFADKFCERADQLDANFSASLYLPTIKENDL